RSSTRASTSSARCCRFRSSARSRAFPGDCYPARDRSPGRSRCFPVGALGLRSRLPGGAMTLTKEAKLEIVGKHGKHESDTGSTDVQVALLTTRINELTDHLRTHPKDNHSRRGLLKLVGRRRRMLNYLQRNNLEGYRALIKELGLRR